jgi:hypothetical protein
MNKSELPSELVSINDEIVEHIHAGSALPDNINQLEKWFEGDGWDYLIGDEGLIGYGLDLRHLANFRFYDSELRYEYELDDSAQINDTMRVQYGHELIERFIDLNDGDICPSVHCLEISCGDNLAFIGCLIEIHGQGGPVSYWQGVYKSKDDFLRAIRANHVVMFDEIKNIKDEEMLSLWNRE